jgi:hypothetical protein
MSSHQPQYEDRGEGQAKEMTGTDVGAEKVLVLLVAPSQEEKME